MLTKTANKIKLEHKFTLDTVNFNIAVFLNLFYAMNSW